MLNSKEKDLMHSKSDRLVSMTIVFHLCLMVCKNMLVATNDTMFSYNELFNNLIIVVMAVLYAYVLFAGRLLEKIRFEMIISVFAIAAFILATIILDSNRFFGVGSLPDYVRSAFRTFVAYSLPLFVMCTFLENPKVLLKRLSNSAIFLFLFATFSFVLILASPTGSFSEATEYSMSYGYSLVFVSMMLALRFIEKQGLSSLIFMAITFIYILAIGSRGPLVIAIFVLIFSVLASRSSIKKLLVVGVVLVVALFMLLFTEEIAMLFIDVFDKLGLNSRTLWMLLEGMISSDSGRSVLHERLLAIINQYPITGFGAFASESVIHMPHGLYYDIFANFGYAFGSVFLILLVAMIFKIYKKSTNRAYVTLIFMLGFYIFPRGFFDDGFWTAKELWMIMGLFISYKHYKPEKYELEQVNENV